MAEVGQKRSPRLPKGPKLLDIEDEVVLDAPLDNKSDKSETTTNNLEIQEDEFKEIKRAKIPEPPSRTIRDPQVLYDYLASLKEEHWIQLSWYLYRTYPVIIREEENKYIECNVIAFNEEYILKNHGSGEYMVMLNDSGRPKNAKTMLKAYIKINNVDYPPMVNMSELDVGHPSNKRFVDYCITKGLLTVDRKPMNTLQNNQGGMNSDAVINLLGKVIDKLDNKNQNQSQKDPTQDALTTVVSMMKEGNTAATKMLLDQMKENSPNTFLSMITAIKELLPKEAPQKSDDSMLMKFMAIMAEKDKTIMTMMEKMIDMKTGNSGGGEDSFDKFLDRFTKFSELTGLGENRGGGKKSTLEVALQYGMPAVERAFGIIQNLLALKAQGTQTLPTNNNPLSREPNASIPVSITSSPLPPEVDAEGNAEVDAEGNVVENKTDNKMSEAMSQNQEQMIKRGVVELGPKIIEALDRGNTGDMFADGINNFLGPQAYDIIAGLGEEKIVSYLKENKQLWAGLAPREKRLRIFIKEFIEWGEPENEGDEDLKKEDTPTDINKKEGVIN